MAARKRRKRRGIAALVGTLACLFAAPPAQAEYSVRVDSQYFGVNYPLLHFDTDPVREAQLRSIRAAGIGTVRAALSWAALEPEAPTGVHNYNWMPSDTVVGRLATHGLRMAPTFMYTPQWAAPAVSLTCHGQSVTTATNRPGDYAAAVSALVQRYGPNGSFWAQNPQLPKVPITTWQIWNEPNLRTYWCPNPDPGAYAELFSQAAAAINAADPTARVVTSGLVLNDRSGSFMNAGEFWSKMSRPDVWSRADGIGFHIFPGGRLEQQFDQIVGVRRALIAAGVPTSLPLYGTEVGWGLTAIDEGQRAQRYDYVTERMPSSNCNVSVMYAHAWTTSPPGGIVYDNDSGIADRNTGALFPSAVAFRDAIKVLSGRGNREARHDNLKHCEGMPKLDRDGDKRAEHRDYYPFDPRRWKGPPGWYDGIRLKAKGKQRLDKPVVVRARCDENCRLTLKGKLKLGAAKGKGALKLKKVRAKLDGGTPRKLKLRPTAGTARRLEATSATKAKAVITAVSLIDDESFDASTRVKLRRR